jgi:competence protein ComEC
MILIAISCAWVLGIYLGSIYNLPLAWSLTGLLPVAFIFFFKRYRKYAALAAAGLATLFLAAFYYPIGINQDNRIISYNNQADLEIIGSVAAQPEIHDKIAHIELSVQGIKTNSNWEQIKGKVLVYVSRYPEYRYGDILRFKGKLESPPHFADFDYQAYLEKEGIYSIMRFPSVELIQRDTGAKPLEWIYTLRIKLSQVLAKVLPEPQSSLAQGIILGIRSTIPDTLKTSLSLTGTAHLLAISGINLSIIAGILITVGLWIFGRRYYIYVWLALFIIWFYAIITGIQPPVIRSAIMASIFLLAELLGRQKNAFVALAFSAAIMVGITPQILWNVSFQLSFLAMMGLIFITPPVQHLLRKAVYAVMGEAGLQVKITTIVTDSLAVTSGALIAVWPIIAYYFGIVSFIGPVATLLIAPSLPIIIILGAITAATGLFSLAVAQIIGWSAWLFLSYMIWLVNAFAAWPMAAVNVEHIHKVIFPVYYSAAGLAVIYYTNIKKFNKLFPELLHKIEPAMRKIAGVTRSLSPKWVAIVLLVPALLTSYATVTLPDGNLHVSILDVGEGEAILIQMGNKNILIDGGPSPQAVCLG